MKRILFIFLLAIISINGLHADEEWKGAWISTMSTQSTPNTWLAFRKTVSISAVPQTLNARIAADSKYWLWINGQMVVFEGGLKRGPMPGGTYYDVVDIAPYLTEGENIIAVLVWHFGKNGFSHINSGMAGLLFDAVGDGVEIISDRSWRCKVYDAYGTTGSPTPNFRLSESNILFDGRKAMSGWTELNYDGKFGETTIVAAADAQPFGTLVERPIPLWKDFGLKSYANVERVGDTLRCRLPYNCQMTPYLKVRGEAGKLIKIQTDNLRVVSQYSIRAEYITREGEQEYESLGWMNGHEVMYIIPEGVEVIDVMFRETGYDTDFRGSFSCDDDFLNELWNRARRTLYVTMRDTYMDCPDRERAQWFGDETIELGEAFYALSPSSHALALKGIHEIINWQRADGTLFGPCPTGNYFVELPLQMLAYIGWYGFYTYYYYSGDSSFVADVYDRMHSYIHDAWTLDDDGFPIMRSGEWDWSDWGKNYDKEVLTTCWYYLALKAEHAFALMLGKTADASADAALMADIEGKFDDRYWNGTAYRSKAYTGETDDRSQGMAVVCGLASEDKYPALLDVLHKEYHASPYMEKYVLEAIFIMGDTDFAIERMHRQYGNMINNYPNYTTLFELWTTRGGSINHAWTGGPLTLLSQYVCGIVPTSPGFETFKVCPQMGSLKEASAVVDTKYGCIKVSVERKGKKLKVNVDAPEGTRVTASPSM